MTLKLSLIPAPPSPRCKKLLITAITRPIREGRLLPLPEIDNLRARLEKIDLDILLQIYEENGIGAISRGTWRPKTGMLP
jgi:hypothetical protein